MSDVELRTTQVDLSGLMMVLGEHLYSTPAVALRELVQNAHDSIVRRRVEEGPVDGRIAVDGEDDTLVVRDNGAGLTRDEIIRFLATVGAGYTRTLRDKTDDPSLIGYFGLGFLSAFVVAEQVVVTTTSYQDPGETWIYSSRGGERYTLAPGPAREVGTEVRLHLKPNFRALAVGDALEKLLARYAALLPIPVWCGGVEVNAEAPPWRDPEPDPVLRLHRALAFAGRFERHFQPICTFPVHGAVEGMLWVQDGATWATSDNRNLSVFVRGMLLDDDARDLLPVWAGFVGGAIESSKLTPVASREDLQRDAAWEEARSTIAEALITALAELPRRSPEAWRRVRARHGEALLGAALVDPRLFDGLARELLVPTSEGELPAEKLVREGRIYVSLSTRGGFEEMLFRALKVPIAAGTRYGVLAFLRRWAERVGGRVVELGTEAGNRDVFRAAIVGADVLDYLVDVLAEEDDRVVAASFVPSEVALVRVPDREAELKRRVEDDETDRRISTAALGLARLFTAQIQTAATHVLYVNVDSPAIQALIARRPPADHRAVRLLRALAALTTTGEPGTVELRPVLGDYAETVCYLLEGG